MEKRERRFMVIESDEDIILEVVKKADLSATDMELLRHDVNNLRGNEWLDVVEDTGDKELLRVFKQMLKRKGGC